MVDTWDSGSHARKGVRVQVPSPAKTIMITTIIISAIYGGVLFTFIHSLLTNHSFTSLRKSFRIAYNTSLTTIFVSSTFNFISFFLNQPLYNEVNENLITISVLSLSILIGFAYSKKYVLPNILIILSITLSTTFSLFGIHQQKFFNIISLSQIAYIPTILSMKIILADTLIGVIRNDERYTKSDVHLKYNYTIALVSIPLLLFLIKFTLPFVIDNTEVKHLIQGIFLSLIIISLFYLRRNLEVYLKSKIEDENRKFLTLYKTAVDEIVIGREVVEKLLPNKKHIRGIEFEKYFKPAVLIGGDFIDIIPLSESKFIAYIADVSGHGISAGIIVSMLKALILKEVVEGYSNLTAVIRNLNSDFNNLISQTGRYSTLFITLIDKNKKKFQYVSCGHIDCLYWSSTLNEFFLLSSTAPILGLLNKIDAYSSDIDFDHNDYIILLSDGLFSITTKDGETFSIENFMNIVSKYINPQIMPNELMFKVSQEIENIIETGHVVDDITMLFLKL